ncbi:hypothetical protein [Halococcoides cellulosivorans]|uniref:DUF8069 domain-containing protein n=1 Tax=Halococcoides cellulosivorans TaxID=1679096 RepID=A0A2R4X3P9_9EURY|nr:hypothetical protein [Halococcoides cellulosivorans]AWB28425.1 hypothetical protein HARCEL1_12305 [Halococcoides cellulosivorans]
MDTPDPHDDTSADYEQIEATLLAQDRDIPGVDTADIDDAMARNLISDLVDGDVVTPIPEHQVLVHEPSGTAFDSTTLLAVFHRGWTAARYADEE